MITYKIPNIAPNVETGEMVVFYQFSNGETFSNRVPITTPVSEIQQWGQEKCTWFGEREAQIEEMRIAIAEEEQRKLEEEQVIINE